jgi:hypothetical protein
VPYGTSLWHRLLEPVSKYRRLCHWAGATRGRAPPEDVDVVYSPSGRGLWNEKPNQALHSCVRAGEGAGGRPSGQVHGSPPFRLGGSVAEGRFQPVAQSAPRSHVTHTRGHPRCPRVPMKPTKE